MYICEIQQERSENVYFKYFKKSLSSSFNICISLNTEHFNESYIYGDSPHILMFII